MPFWGSLKLDLKQMATLRLSKLSCLVTEDSLTIFLFRCVDDAFVELSSSFQLHVPNVLSNHLAFHHSSHSSPLPPCPLIGFAVNNELIFADVEDSDLCCLTLFPEAKLSHADAEQLFICSLNLDSVKPLQLIDQKVQRAHQRRGGGSTRESKKRWKLRNARVKEEVEIYV
jgi:hypothetical protein